MSSPSLYDYPEIYDSVRAPDSETFESIYNLICSQLGRRPQSVMDPACGPATWLAQFAREGIMVAGNDICESMIAAAQEKCNGQALEFKVGDMLDLRLSTGPYEVVFELAGTCGMLSNERDFRKLLGSIVEHTAQNGLILLTVFFDDGRYDHYPWLVGEWGPFSIKSGGKAWLRYEVLSSDMKRNIDRVRRTVKTIDVDGCCPNLVDEYDMFSWKEEHFWNVVGEYRDLEFITAFQYDEPSGISSSPRGDFIGETTVVFRKRG